MPLGTHLKIEEEGDPLVVLVVPFLVVLVGAVYVGVGDARVGDHIAHLSACEGGDREGGMDPAVGVHDAGAHTFHDAVDGVAEILFLRDEQTERHQQEHSALVV